MWTRFMDMHSGGGLKEAFAHCYIEAPEAEAKVIFYNRFGHNPERVTCTCCGEDYSISSEESLDQITAFERGCAWDKEQKKYIEAKGNLWLDYHTLDEWLALPNACVIYAKDIKDDERTGDVPEQGYVWVQ